MMLPGTKAIFDHPRVQADPVLRAIIEQASDWNRFRATSHEDLALHVGFILGYLHTVLLELDAKANPEVH